jgi:hypothetical protein
MKMSITFMKTVNRSFNVIKIGIHENREKILKIIRFDFKITSIHYLFVDVIQNVHDFQNICFNCIYKSE